MVGVGAVATESVCFRVAALVSGLFVRDESVRKEQTGRGEEGAFGARRGQDAEDM